ncbi:uncharacterized protein LOC122398128 isoform X2 [Colletes gigas]|uniref:uncharacterized protein LOC122398128 isoform X2 n=1 Tax=Colletes gigas TaxID=935657 RepID=UPI001C9B7295|nr:uncharacterized protein LOC122398128 isoform X2 [Colletes gigas]
MASENTSTDTTSTKFYTKAEVAEHTNSSSSPWIVIDNNVYDVTSFLKEHPDRKEIRLHRTGRDSTEAFEDIGLYSDDRLMLVQYKIGEIVKEAEPEKITESDAMSKENNAKKNMESESTATDTTKFYTTAEVAEHTDTSSLWIIINNSVYDLTTFLDKHPGGPAILVDHAGRDSTEAFEDIGHSSDARLMMVQYKIGEIVKEAEPEKTTESDAMSKENNAKKNMESESTATDTTKFYTTAEVAEHTDTSSLWIIINNSVYDLTTFLDKHPGGPAILVDHAGRDSTEAFEDIGHSSDARLMMVQYKIGEIVKEAEPEKTTESDAMSKENNAKKNMESESTATDTTKFYTTAEVAEHTDTSSLWIIINNSVYDLTTFLDKHPGGPAILVDQAGRDSTEAFEDIGHSSDARLMMVPYKIGEILKEDEPEKTAKSDEENNSSRCCIVL